jgi:acyl-coenzyme A thioesterase PaaI-like protein
LTATGVSVDLSTSFCSDANLGDVLIIVAESEKIGRRLAFGTATLYRKNTDAGVGSNNLTDLRGKIVARGTHTKFVEGVVLHDRERRDEANGAGAKVDVKSKL